MIEYVSRLPAGYQEVEYIESTGTQWIDTGISVPHATARVVVDFEITSIPTSSEGPYSVTGHTNNAFNWTTNFLYIYTDSTFAVCGVVAGSATKGQRYVFDYNSNGYSVNGGNFVSAARTYTDGYNDTIFYSSGRYSKFRLYAYKLYDGNTLVRDMIPCYRKSDHVAGMYDLANGVFYTNAGSGVFTKGADVGGSISVTPGGIIPQKYALRRRMMISGGGVALPPVDTPLENWTWEQIIALSNSGTDPRNYFAVGDQKNLVLTTGEIVPTVIGDFYHNTITGTNIKAPIAFTFKNCLNTTYKMNDSWTNAGGWDGSNMRKTHMENIFNTFPAELRADGAVKYVDVVATAGSTSTTLVTSSDRLRLHSITELGLTYHYAGTEGTKYAYYTSGNRIKTVNGSVNYYWTRSPSTANSGTFCFVDSSGNANHPISEFAYGVACGFDI